jgi:hypothetical protein
MSSDPNASVTAPADANEDPFRPLTHEREVDDFKSLVRKLATLDETPAALPAAVTARFCGFNLDDGPLVCGLPGLPGEIVLAQTIIPLLREQIGSQVLVLFDRGEVRRPIVIGLLQQARPSSTRSAAAPLVSVQSDEQRLVLMAEREIELRCGDASITLTRAGKILIQGNYILSRSSGYNKIKGAAVDIN